MCENKDHNQQSFSVSSIILLGSGHRFGITEGTPQRCFPDGVGHITQQCFLVQTWMCCKHKLSTAAVLQTHLIQAVLKTGKNLLSPVFKRYNFKNCKCIFSAFQYWNAWLLLFVFSFKQDTLPLLFYFFYLRIRRNLFPKRAEALTEIQKSIKYFSLPEITERKTGNCSCLSLFIYLFAYLLAYLLYKWQKSSKNHPVNLLII